MTKQLLTYKGATLGSNPGSFKDNAVVTFKFNGNEKTARKYYEAINNVIEILEE